MQTPTRLQGSTGGYGFEAGVSGSWDGAISTFGNVVFEGSGGSNRLSDVYLTPGASTVTGNGTITLIGEKYGLNTIATFASSGGLPYSPPTAAIRLWRSRRSPGRVEGSGPCVCGCTDFWNVLN